jgi:hypothetical protein
LFLHNHSISILSPEKQEFFPVFSYPEEAVIRGRGEAIIRSNNIYFGVYADQRKKQEFNLWKYDTDAKEL